MKRFLVMIIALKVWASLVMPDGGDFPEIGKGVAISMRARTCITKPLYISSACAKLAIRSPGTMPA